MAAWFDTIFIIILENHGWSQVQGCQFVDWFTKNGVVFNNWSAATHPSGPNYRALFSGNYWSNNEFDNVHRPNIGDLVKCTTVFFRGVPADRHNPFLDMQSSMNIARASIIDAPVDQAKGIYYFGMDDNNDAHNGDLNGADHNAMDAINLVVSTRKDNNYLIFLTFDEAFGLEWVNNHVFTGMYMPGMTRPSVIHSPVNHYNFARNLYQNWGMTPPAEMDSSSLIYDGRFLLTLS